MKRQEELNEAWCKYAGKCSTEIMQALAFALRWCDEHPNWISVEVELPMHKDVESENSEIVVVTDGYKRDIGFYNYLMQRWYTVYEDIKITHWTPMPELPKGGER